MFQRTLLGRCQGITRGLGIGRNAPVTPSVATDAAVMLQSPVYSVASRSVTTSTPAFVRLYEQARHGTLKSIYQLNLNVFLSDRLLL